MAEIVLPGSTPTGDDQEVWRELLEVTLPQMKREIEAINSQLGRR